MKRKTTTPRFTGIKAQIPAARVPRKPGRKAPPFVLMIGNSTRTLELIGLLKADEATGVADVRTMPRSRHNRQFNRDTLPAALQAADIGCVHLAELGGFRPTTPDSPNLGWPRQIAVMCAEAVPWRCHRLLIADALLIRGIQSEDISSANRRAVHALTPFAKVRGTTITYPVPAASSTAKPPPVKRSRLHDATGKNLKKRSPG